MNSRKVTYKSGKQERKTPIWDEGKIEPVAILVSDIHLSHKPPLFRSAEPDWYRTMKGYLSQLLDLSLSQSYELPVIAAGDIFDRASSCCELVNFALHHLPHLYAVCGQHDLINHVYSDIRKTAFYTLVQAGKITLLEPSKPIEVQSRSPIRLHGFPYGFIPTPLLNPHDMLLEVAVVHRYIYTKKTGFYGAPKEKRLGNQLDNLRGFDVCHFGDNHSTILAHLENTTVFNPGSLMIRTSDQTNHRPCVGILFSDGSVKKHYLNTSADVYLDLKSDLGKAVDSIDSADFLRELASLSDGRINFEEVLQRTLDNTPVSKEVRTIILKALEKRKQ